MTSAPITQATPQRLGVWRRRVHPVLLNRIMDTVETRRIRERVCSGLHGEVLEIGFGTGLNLPHLPDGVHRVLAVEPVRHGWKLAAGRAAAAEAAVDYVGSDARALPIEDASVDAVLCTWSLCSIDSPERAVAEVARVLRPGGRLHFVEHGRAEEERTRRRQSRVDGVWSWLTCGCHLDRDIPSILEAGGLRLARLRTYFTESEPKFLGWTYEGTATTSEV